MKRGLFLLSAAAAAACIPPAPAQPGPKNASSRLAPPAAIATAARLLTGDGFEVTTADGVSGILTAKRTRAQTGNASYITCRYAHGSAAETQMESTVTVSIVAKPASSGSDVSVTSRVHVEFPGLRGGPIALPPSDTDCASNGTLEGSVISALAASADRGPSGR